MLQLLASRCLLLHKQHVQHQRQQQQQGQVLIRQLGKRMRGDLLLLADPRDQLLPLLPNVEFQAADAASLAAVDSSFVVYSVIFCLTALGVGISNSNVSSRNHPGMAAAVLQLFSQLLPMAAAHWQQTYHSFSQQQQQQLLLMEAADLGHDRPAELQRIEQQLKPVQQLFKRCSELLQAQLSTLWDSG
jgi:hypothetical protein